MVYTSVIPLLPFISMLFSLPQRLKTWRRQRVLARHPIADHLWHATLDALPFVSGFTEQEYAQLRELATLFIQQKHFTGAAGLQVSDAMRVFIATQACLLILHLDLDYYRGWDEIIVYPSQFTPKHEYTDEAGVVHVSNHPFAGESWLGGPVVLSWEDAAAGGQGDGYNVVLHEFAHKLDMLNGNANGFPPLHKNMSRAEWVAACKAAFANFVKDVNNQIDTIIDPYAAEHPAEFFAVFTEAFFEMPDVVFEAYADVYRQFALFYKQDPLQRLRLTQTEHSH
jgi:MtfA peptidase